MSIIRNAKEFFGLGPIDDVAADEYYADEPRSYADERSFTPERHYDYAPPRREPHIVPVVLTSYTQAARVGEPFREGDAVVFDITNMDRKEATRIVDFAAGICFALEGEMLKVAPRVFAVVPKGGRFGRAELERAARVR
ncbi:hypothetical protein CATYP_07290 [Corynebacterium atypicum]|uniref:Cell division protein SepF n=1 Tax=Corynebacterium atypicum TaxID=191610 RepID=A0ABM5QNK8_9CORY|nr:cell division protein SepF [Corynebacterium atypicum]AIG64423.1 hypothetical protein CATYP_07290 [Corynebacterium atypicum]